MFRSHNLVVLQISVKLVQLKKIETINMQSISCFSACTAALSSMHVTLQLQIHCVLFSPVLIAPHRTARTKRYLVFRQGCWIDRVAVDCSHRFDYGAKSCAFA